MIPIANPAVRSFRLLRVIVVAVRVARLVYRVFGERFTNRLVDQLTDPVVEAIKRPVILMVLDEVVKVVETGNIPLGLAAALRENSDELEQLVVEKLNEDPTTGRLAMLPFSERITRAMIETTLRVVPRCWPTRAWTSSAPTWSGRTSSASGRTCSTAWRTRTDQRSVIGGGFDTRMPLPPKCFRTDARHSPVSIISCSAALTARRPSTSPFGRPMP